MLYEVMTLDCADVGDEIQSVGTDERARHQKTGNGGESKLMEQKHDGNRDRKNDEKIAENIVASHV